VVRGRRHVLQCPTVTRADCLQNANASERHGRRGAAFAAACNSVRQPGHAEWGVQSGTAVVWRCLYALNMETEHVKVASIAVWILAVGLVGYMSGITSLAGWTVLAG